jgi:hypothetical protein
VRRIRIALADADAWISLAAPHKSLSSFLVFFCFSFGASAIARPNL